MPNETHQLADRRLRSLSVPLIVIAAFSGCGGGRLERYPISGTVTYEDKPVEAGMIFFEPTESAGPVAPSTYLPIKNGIYEAGEDGPTKGKYRVTVGGFDLANERKDAEGMVFTPSLFPDYKFDTEIPPPDNELNIQVPSTP